MLQMRQMTPADIPTGMRLKEEAGWNQTDADWQRFLALEPTGCFIAEDGGEGVGTVTAFVLGSVAWIAMVLVDARRRGQGIGTALMEHALAYLDGRGVPTVRLDATPLGSPVYEKLGFTAEYELSRYTGIPAAGTPDVHVRPYAPADLEDVLWLDRRVAGTDRCAWLTRLLNERPQAARVAARDDLLLGCATLRPGTRATHIGPCLALTRAAGRALLADALARCAGTPVILDIPTGNTEAAALVTEAGLAVERSFLRMYRGVPPVDEVEHLWASTGPEKG